MKVHLTHVKFKESNIWKNITAIGDGAFANCTALETIKLPNNEKY